MGLNAQAASNVAHVLTEALPYIQRFSGRTVVIKYGGKQSASTPWWCMAVVRRSVTC